MTSSSQRLRCSWAKPNNPLYVEYHDTEWGVSRDLSDDDLFELLTLEAFQSGLSWETILNKRSNFKKAFSNFRIDSVARMGKGAVERLMKNAGIVRNRRKIEATLQNAGALRTLIGEEGSFSAFLMPYMPSPRRAPPKRLGDLHAFTEESKRLSKDLKTRGFAFVGPTVVYSFMQAAGFVNDHLACCFLATPPG